jgi:hypothetical protein
MLAEPEVVVAADTAAAAVQRLEAVEPAAVSDRTIRRISHQAKVPNCTWDSSYNNTLRLFNNDRTSFFRTVCEIEKTDIRSRNRQVLFPRIDYTPPAIADKD